VKIEKDRVVAIEYTLSDGDGKLIESSRGSAPLAYVHGARSLLPALEESLEGKVSGDEVKVALTAEQAYGARDESLVFDVKRDQFPPDAELHVGMAVRKQTPEGDLVLHVVAVEEDGVKLDANHPLAGIALEFDVTVADVREASAEELEHGHVHGPGGVDHG
jgi:FKBP-type peptidyl-prolyl cis-trans isomerase SlyD